MAAASAMTQDLANALPVLVLEHSESIRGVLKGVQHYSGDLLLAILTNYSVLIEADREHMLRGLIGQDILILKVMRNGIEKHYFYSFGVEALERSRVYS